MGDITLFVELYCSIYVHLITKLMGGYSWNVIVARDLIASLPHSSTNSNSSIHPGSENIAIRNVSALLFHPSLLI